MNVLRERQERMMASTKVMSGLLTGKVHCKVHFDESRIVVEIEEHGVDPDRFFLGQAVPEELVVNLQDGKVATAFDIVPLSKSGNLGFSSYLQTRLAAYRTLVGPEVFQADRLIDAIEFTPSNEMIAIYYQHYRNHAELQREQMLPAEDLLSVDGVWAPIIVDVIDRDRLTASDVQVDGTRVQLAVGISTNHTAQGSTTTERRRARLDYSEPQELRQGLQDIASLCDFFSLVVGEVIIPQEIEIVSGEPDQLGMKPRFSVHVGYRPAGRDLDPKFPHRCIVSPHRDLEAYGECLGVWMARRDQWLQSYRLGTESISRQHEITRYRFLDAIGWFESISDFYLPEANKIPKDVVSGAAHAAAQSFAESGHTVDENRIRGLLSPINVLSLNLRLKAAIDHIQSRYGTSALPSDAASLSGMIASIRGTFAHGENAFEGELGPRVYEATLLVESICQLLMLSQLPLPIQRIGAAHHHPLNNARQQLAQFHKQRSEPMDAADAQIVNS